MVIKNTPLFHWVLIAKGIGIILVVIGHFYPDDSPEYWTILRNSIYTFHMPLFFILSGFLYRYTKYSYSTLVRIKIKRLLYPFISVAIIFFIIKYPAGMLFHLEYPLEPASIYALFIDPVNSYKPLLWFVHALFLMFLVYPLLRSIVNNNYVILLIFVLVNEFLGNDYLVIGKALAHIPFFIVGIMLRESSALRDKVIPGSCLYIVSSVIFFLTCVFAEMKIQWPSGYVLRLMSGLSGAICVMNMSILIAAMRKRKRVGLEIVGCYSMTIYLFHTFFESAVRIGYYQVLVGCSVPFEIVALSAIVAGIVFPLLLEKMILRNNRFTRKYLLGLTDNQNINSLTKNI